MLGKQLRELGDRDVAQVPAVLLEETSSREGLVGRVLKGVETPRVLVEREGRGGVARVGDRGERLGEVRVDVRVLLVRERVRRLARSRGLQG